MTLSNPKSTGVLFVQLGTPDAPTEKAVRRYLKEFLSDRRVVDTHRFLWLPLLHGIILRTRPRHSAALYQKIWRADGLSPLLYYTQKQAQAVATILGPHIQTRFAMRYGTPPLTQTLLQMVDSGIERLLIVPLFPHYSAATTATLLDAVQSTFAHQRKIPTLRFAQPFFDQDDYINPLVRHIQNNTSTLNDPYFVFSFHGLPQRHVDQGDPYADQCKESARRLVDGLKLPKNRWIVTFQSRFGREPWLTPSTQETLTQLPKQGHKHIVLTCPGFVSDCLETLEEMEIQGKKSFLNVGGESFHYVPCLNDTTPWLQALARITQRELAGWFE